MLSAQKRPASVREVDGSISVSGTFFFFIDDKSESKMSMYSERQKSNKKKHVLKFILQFIFIINSKKQKQKKYTGLLARERKP